jgi:transcriptional regulator with XRE-family HTH domain
VHNAESGRGVSAKTGRALAEALGVSVEELAPSPKALPRLEVFELPGLDEALEYYGMSHNELAFKAGMTPGELLDYKIGVKKPSEETVDHLADTLGAFRVELVDTPEAAAKFRATNQQENREAKKKLAKKTDAEISEEILRDPASRLIRDAYAKNDAEHHAERGREDKLA